MKKGMALLAALVLLFSCALADQTVELPGGRRFLTLPDAMTPVSLKPGDDALMAYLSPTLEMDVFSFANETDKSIHDVADWIVSEGYEAQIQRIGGIDMVVFQQTDETASCIGYNFLDGDQVLQIVFWYADQAAADQAGTIMAGIW